MKAKCALAALIMVASVFLSGCGKSEPPAPKPIMECKDEKILQEVLGNLSQTLDWPLKDMNTNMRMVEDLGVAGPQRIQIRMDLENAFGIKIHEDEIKEARTVSELAYFVEQKLAKKK